MKEDECFELDEIVVFDSGLRFETFISTIRPVHLEYPGLVGIRKATLEEKKQWYENEEHELIIEGLFEKQPNENIPTPGQPKGQDRPPCNQNTD